MSCDKVPSVLVNTSVGIYHSIPFLAPYLHASFKYLKLWLLRIEGEKCVCVGGGKDSLLFDSEGFWFVLVSLSPSVTNTEFFPCVFDQHKSCGLVEIKCFAFEASKTSERNQNLISFYL